MYEVQKDVPIPTVNHAPRKGRRKYPFESMDVGDMFFVPNKTTNSIGAHVSNVAKQLGRRYSSRQMVMCKSKGEWVPCHPAVAGATKGVGVWRTK